MRTASDRYMIRPVMGRAVVLALTWSVAGLAPALAQTVGTQEMGYLEPPVDSRYAAAVHEARRMLLQFMEDRGIPGLSAAAAVDGQIVWAEGFGYADVENRVPVTTVSKFRSGSIAKSMTGTGLALLVERGMIELDAPVRRYVPEWPDKHPTITLRQLAGMQGGLRHYNTPSRSYHQTHRYTDLVEAIEWFKDEPLLFEPGSRYSYSSYGYNLLGMAMQRAAGEPFHLFIDRNVLEPLGMRSTVPDHSDSIIAHRVSFYERTGGTRSFRKLPRMYELPEGTLFNAPSADNSYKTPSGGFLTTPEDLLRFCLGVALHPRPGFMRPETRQLLLMPMLTSEGEETGYALGWRHGTDERGYHSIGHGGGGVGTNNQLLCYPEEDVAVAVMVNFTDAGYGDLPRRLAWLFIER